MAFSRNRQKTPRFSYRISQGLVIGLVLLVSVIIVTSFSIIWFEGKPILNQMSLDNQAKLGQNISLAMERELEQVTGISSSLAAVAMGLPEDSRMQTLPKVIPKTFKDRSDIAMIAGGGIWPEPGVFEAGVSRNSFFWARSASGDFEFIDEYNAPSGPGYHREEWYVPARVFDSAVAYWSKSYTDPYSSQPMVTCTTPMRDDDGMFRGVATVDLKLDGLSVILNQLIAGLNAYAFIVDRNNRFIVFPTLGINVSRARTYSNSAGFEYLDDLVEVYPAFEIISQHLESLDTKLLRELALERPEYRQLVNRLTEGSYQISGAEAERLVANEWLNEKHISKYPKPLDVFDISNDILLRGGATALIYQMPSTDWRVVTVFEKKAYGAISEVLSKKLVGAILLSSLLFGAFAYVLLKVLVTDRIVNMVNMLTLATRKKNSSNAKLEYQSSDELGLLSYWFNHRTVQLEDALQKLKNSNHRKSEFLHGVSQELRKPISMIISFNRKLIVKVGGDLDKENYHTLLDIQKYSSRMLTLIDDIFEVSQLEVGAASLDFRWESTNLLLDDACCQVAAKLAEANLTFKTRSLTNDARIWVDRQRIIQALLHLLSNAMDATKEGEISIDVSAEAWNDGDAVAFSISDTGSGIGEEIQEQMRKQFTDIEEYKGQENGIGLGLYLVREIVMLHSGAISFQSVPEKGSTFKMIIPVKRQQLQSRANRS